MARYVQNIGEWESEKQIWRTHVNETIFTGYVTGEGECITTVTGMKVAPVGAVVGKDGKVLKFDSSGKKFDGTPVGVLENSVDVTLGEDEANIIVQGDLIGAALWYGEGVDYTSDVFKAMKEALPRIYLEDPATQASEAV